MVTLSRLFIHPVKSMRGMGLTHAFADISGLAFDRLLWSPKPTAPLLPPVSFRKW